MSTHYLIGAFAELCGVSAKTLRYYDKAGVLRPASVYPRTGYRRYLPQQLEQMASILALKNLGLPLAQVGAFTAKTGASADRRAILNDLKRKIEHSVQTATQSLNWINAALGELDRSIARYRLLSNGDRLFASHPYASSLATMPKWQGSRTNCRMRCRRSV